MGGYRREKIPMKPKHFGGIGFIVSYPKAMEEYIDDIQDTLDYMYELVNLANTFDKVKELYERDKDICEWGREISRNYHKELESTAEEISNYPKEMQIIAIPLGVAIKPLIDKTNNMNYKKAQLALKILEDSFKFKDVYIETQTLGYKTYPSLLLDFIDVTQKAIKDRDLETMKKQFEIGKRLFSYGCDKAIPALWMKELNDFANESPEHSYLRTSALELIKKYNEFNFEEFNKTWNELLKYKRFFN